MSGRNEGSGTRRRSLHGWLVAAVLFALAGVVASGVAWRTHWLVRTRPPEFRPACQLSAEIDCARTARSPYAVVARVPIALWSAIGFALLTGLALAGVRRETNAAFGAGLLFALAAVAALVSVVMALISRLVLSVLCIECTVIQVLAVAVFVCAVFQLRELGRGPVRALAADLTVLWSHRRATLAAGAAGIVGVAALVALYPEHRWTGHAVLPDLPVRVGMTRLAGPGDLATGVTEEGHPFIGAARPVATVVEYTDYQCPFCRQAHLVLRDFVRRHPDRLRLVHMHLPLDHSCNPALERPFHREACRLAAAVSCAAAQGRFWAMNDAVFERQVERRPVDVEALAEEAGVSDLAAFRRCLEEGTGLTRVRRDVDEGLAMLREAGFGVGTPAFEVRDAQGRMVGRYLGFGGEQGMPESVLRRLEAGWPAEH